MEYGAYLGHNFLKIETFLTNFISTIVLRGCREEMQRFFLDFLAANVHENYHEMNFACPIHP